MGLDLSLKLGRTVSAPRGTYTRLGDGFQKLKTHLLKKGAAEHTLGKIENILASKYESLLGYLDVRKFPSRDVTCEILDHLICLISMLIVRNPVYLNAERGCADDFANQLKASGFLTEEDRAALKAEGFEGEFNSIVEYVLQGIVLFNFTDSTPLLSLVSLMRDMDCCFCVAPDGSEFITSSYPAFAEWADLKDADPYSIYFPLSPRYGAAFKRKSDSERLVRISPINSSMVDTLNDALVNGNDAWDCLISRDRERLETITAL